MTRAYCTRCGAERDTSAGHCPEGHRVAIERPGYVGRHRARVVVPRMQVLEVLGFSDHGTTVATPVSPSEPPRRVIPSTPRRSSRPVGRHRAGTPTSRRTNASLPSLTLATVDTEPSENTGVLVERLWEASDDTMAGVEEWHGSPASDSTDPGRRWWPWAMAVLSIAAAVAAVWVLPGVFEDRAQAQADSVTAAVADATADLGHAREVALTIVDPGASPADLSGMAVELTSLDSAARELLDQAVIAQELEGTDATAIGQAGELALSLERRLSSVLTYRLLIESAVAVPELPTTASGDEIGALARSLSESLTSLRTDVASLPSDELLDAHRLETETVVEGLAADQAAYLAAIRDGDASQAGTIAERMQASVEGIHEDLDVLLAGLRPWIEDTVAAIEANLS